MSEGIEGGLGQSTEKKEEILLASVEIKARRHSLKGKTPDGREPLTAKGALAAVEAGLKGDHAEQVEQKIKEGDIDVYGSPRERTSQSSVFRMFAEQFKNSEFENVDPQDIVRWLEEGGLENVQTKLLDFQVGDGKFKEEILDSFKKGELMIWLSEKSDEAAVEYKQNPETAAPISIVAGDVAAFFWALGKMKADQIMEKGGDNRTNINFATSHGMIFESFLYKALEKGMGEQYAKDFIKETPAQFSENEGFDVVYQAKADGDWQVQIKYKDKEFALSSKEMTEIIQEGEDLKRKLEKNRE